MYFVVLFGKEIIKMVILAFSEMAAFFIGRAPAWQWSLL